MVENDKLVTCSAPVQLQDLASNHLPWESTSIRLQKVGPSESPGIVWSRSGSAVYDGDEFDVTVNDKVKGKSLPGQPRTLHAVSCWTTRGTSPSSRCATSTGSSI